MNRPKAIWFDGQTVVIQPETQVASGQQKMEPTAIQNQAFLRGWGLFETMLAVGNQNELRIPWLRLHLDRLVQSCKALSIDAPQEKSIETAIHQTIAELSLWNASPKSETQFFRVRVTVPAGDQGDTWWTTKKSGGLFVVHAEEIDAPRQDPITGYLLPTPFSVNQLIAGHKTTSYLPYLLAARAAKDSGRDEAILSNEKGELIEGATSNLFFVSKNHLITPPLSSGCLKGTARFFVIEAAKEIGLEVVEQTVIAKIWTKFEIVLATNAAAGIRQVIRPEKKEPSRHETLLQLQKMFIDSLINN